MIEVKYFFLFAVIVTIITAVPLHLASDNNVSQKLNVLKFLRESKSPKNSSMAMGKYMGLMQSTGEYEVKPEAENVSQRNFRLPNNTEPVSYNLRLSTDIHRGDFAFEGNLALVIRALENTNSITLHSRQTIIERIDLFNSNGTLFDQNVPYLFDSEVEFLVISVNRELEAGEELTIDISYTGFLRTELMGFFRTSYQNSVTNEETWLATTQFQPINARQAFPCYDEVRFRRPINLQIRHHRNYNAISNMPVAELIEDQSEYVTTVFEQTPPIPVFVLAFTVSDFAFVRNNDTDLELRVYARPSAIAAGEADDGLRLGEIMLRTMEDIFDIEYTLLKSDQVAIPSFASDGALNWGLITHREDIILQFSDDVEAQHFREIRTAHEYSHIFFANLVAPSSWAYLWLNEGLATLYENIINDIVFPEKNQWEDFLIRYYDIAVTVDVMSLVPALNHYVETPEEVRSKFDFVTYNKGAIILRMFYEVLLSQTFTKGIRYYILDRQFENAGPEDIYAGLQRAYDEDLPGGELNLSSVMRPWFDLPGYPVVTVYMDDQGISLRQEGFRTLHNESFSIPINFATESAPDFDFTSALYWMTTPELYINRGNSIIPWTVDDWIILNVRDTAYYITNYDDELWEKIITAMNDDREAIHFLNRGTLFADFHRFIQQDFEIRATFIVRLMESLPLEFHPHVFNRASLGLAITEVRLRYTELHSQHRIFMQEIMSQIYGERSFDRTATDIINEWSCWSGVQECLDDSLHVLIEVLETGATDYEFDYQCNGIRAANESIWMSFYYRTIDSTSSGDRSTDLRGLLCTENQDIIRFYLNQALNTTNGLLTFERELILTTAAVQHEISTDVLIDLIELRGVEINLITSLSNLVLGLVSVSNSYIEVERVMSLIYYVPEGDGDLTEEHVIALMQPNLNFIYRNLNELSEWFRERTRRMK